MGRFDTLGSLVSAHHCDHFIDVLSLNHHHHCMEGEQRGDAAILGNRVPKFPETEVDEIL